MICGHSRSVGLTLVEVMVAVSLAAGLLLAGWAWFFTVSATSRSDAATMEASSRSAFARRLFEADVACARLTTFAPGCGRDQVSLVVTHLAEAPELVVYTYESGRQLVWRKSASCHVIQGVRSFGVEYLDEAGEVIAPEPGGRLAPGDAERATAVRVTLALMQGRGVTTTWTASLRPW